MEKFNEARQQTALPEEFTFTLAERVLSGPRPSFAMRILEVCAHHFRSKVSPFFILVCLLLLLTFN